MRLFAMMWEDTCHMPYMVPDPGKHAPRENPPASLGFSRAIGNGAVGITKCRPKPVPSGAPRVSFGGAEAF